MNKLKENPQNELIAKHVATSPLNCQSFTVWFGFSSGQSYTLSKSSTDSDECLLNIAIS